MRDVVLEIIDLIEEQLKETNEQHHAQFGEGVDFSDDVSVELPAYMWVDLLEALKKPPVED